MGSHRDARSLPCLTLFYSHKSSTKLSLLDCSTDCYSPEGFLLAREGATRGRLFLAIDGRLLGAVEDLEKVLSAVTHARVHV